MGYELCFTDKEITAWGDLSLMKQMLDHIGFGSALKRADYRNRAVIEAMQHKHWSRNSSYRYDVALTGLSRVK